MSGGTDDGRGVRSGETPPPGAETDAKPGAPRTAVAAYDDIAAALATDGDGVVITRELLRALFEDMPREAEERMTRLRHDLNNDLTAVLGFSQLIVRKRAEVSETIAQRAERIYEHAKRMAERLAATKDE